MTPKKKPTEVNISGVNEDVQDDHDKVIRASAWKERVWTAVLLAVVASIQVVALKWLDDRNVARSSGTDDKVEVVADKVEAIHKATNSLSEKLLKTTEEEALLRGKDNERQRSDAEEVKPPDRIIEKNK